MGGIVSSLFGGSQEKGSSHSSNQAYNYLNGALSPLVSQGTGAYGSIGALLGQGGDPAAANKAFQNYLGSTGYNFQLQQGSNAITNNAAARGLLNSGATAKALTQYGQNIGSNYFQNYLGQLGSLGQAGLNAANTISGAGNVYNSNSSSSNNKGLVNGLGQAASIFASI